MGVINQFTILLAKKAQREQRRISLSEVQEKTGITWKTLQGWANNQISRYDADKINTLMEYFGLTDIGDLLVYSPKESGNGQKS